MKKKPFSLKRVLVVVLPLIVAAAATGTPSSNTTRKAGSAPGLFKYYAEAPKEIYAKAERK